MNDPLERATSKAPPTLGDGCVRRYDPDALSPENGTSFPDAAELWEQLQRDQAGESDTDTEKGR